MGLRIHDESVVGIGASGSHYSASLTRIPSPAKITTSNCKTMRFKTSVRNIQTFTSIEIPLQREKTTNEIYRAHSFPFLPGKGSMGASGQRCRTLHHHPGDRNPSMGVRTPSPKPLSIYANIGTPQIALNRLHLRRLHHPIRRAQQHNQSRATPPTPPPRPQIRHQRLFSLHSPHEERWCASPLLDHHHEHDI